MRSNEEIQESISKDLMDIVKHTLIKQEIKTLSDILGVDVQEYDSSQHYEAGSFVFYNEKLYTTKKSPVNYSFNVTGEFDIKYWDEVNIASVLKKLQFANNISAGFAVDYSNEEDSLLGGPNDTVKSALETIFNKSKETANKVDELIGNCVFLADGILNAWDEITINGDRKLAEYRYIYIELQDANYVCYDAKIIPIQIYATKNTSCPYHFYRENMVFGYACSPDDINTNRIRLRSDSSAMRIRAYGII